MFPSGRVALRFVSQEIIAQAALQPSVLGRLNYGLQATAKKIVEITRRRGESRLFLHRGAAVEASAEQRKDEDVKNLLSFHDFKEKYVQSWESFKTSQEAKIIYGDNEEKIAKAYDNFCLSQYGEYRRKAYGGSPSYMI
jgi:citrate synthase